MKELYAIRFNKAVLENDMKVTQYVIGFIPAGSSFSVKKIVLKGDKIITTFEDKSSHIIFYTPDVELFYREKVKKNADKT